MKKKYLDLFSLRSERTIKFAILSLYIDLIKNLTWNFLGNCYNMKIDYSGGPFLSEVL